jgi:paraquat-inducible protein A
LTEAPPEIQADKVQGVEYPQGSAAAAGLRSCRRCGTLVAIAVGDTAQRCDLCGKRLHTRQPHSLQKTLALLLTAVLLYFPANLLPIMETTQLGSTTRSTIVEGVWLLWHHGSYPTSMIIFVASVVVPVAKILALLWLCWTVFRRSPYRPNERERLYRITEFVGRWSMVDVFVVALLVALVQIAGIMTVEPGPAALAFCAVVVFTMLAAQAFDARLIWDHAVVGRDGVDGAVS